MYLFVYLHFTVKSITNQTLHYFLPILWSCESMFNINVRAGVCSFSSVQNDRAGLKKKTTRASAFLT